MTALWLGIHAGDRVSHLIPANTAARIGTEASWNVRIAQVAASGMASLVEGTLERWFTASFRDADQLAIETTKQMLLTTSAEGYCACCAAIRDMDQTESVDRIKTPTLVITGAYDPVTPPALGQILQDKIRNSSYLELDAAHLSNIEQSKQFTNAVLNFILG